MDHHNTKLEFSIQKGGGNQYISCKHPAWSICHGVPPKLHWFPLNITLETRLCRLGSLLPPRSETRKRKYSAPFVSFFPLESSQSQYFQRLREEERQLSHLLSPPSEGTERRQAVALMPLPREIECKLNLRAFHFSSHDEISVYNFLFTVWYYMLIE